MAGTASNTALATLALAGLALAGHAADAVVEPRLPRTLRDTGLYAEWEAKVVAAANRPFTPQYPLWTDGARKQRWIYLPPGTAIDATAADAWQFPIGTKLWKEFSFGRRTETRFMERTARGWRYGTYVWRADGREAVLAPARGMLADVEVAPGARHAIPGAADCRVCHANGPTPVLGFSALQLSPDRDPGALHREPRSAGSVEIVELIASGRLRGLPPRDVVPRIAARTPDERAALGYLHGNCGGCHRPGSPLASVGLILAHAVGADAPTALATTLDRASTFTTAASATRIRPGDPARSVLLARVRSRVPAQQMPPLGTQLVDDAAVELLARWISQLAPHVSHTHTTEGALL